jgi:predicted metal-dependent hydrolase
LAAYRRGDFFEAHELLEPAWMGTDDPVERDLYQGLIKLSAAYVHDARGNPTGIAKNLAGARARLAAVADAGALPRSLPVKALELDVPALVQAIEERLAELAAPDADPSDALMEPPVL